MLVSGCGFSGVYDLPLPGGADLGPRPITVHARLDNVDNLVPHEAVKVNFVPVGTVTDISLATSPGGKWMADVTMQINNTKTKLPANTTAELRQTSLLGEKYIQLVAPPQSQAQGHLADGATVKQNATFHHVEVSQVLGALSLLLNNGGLAQIQTISRELQKANAGNEQAIRTTLDNLTQLVTSLDNHRGAITRALDGLNKLSGALNGQKAKLANVIDNLGPGLRVLDQQRDQLVTMLQALQHLSGVTIDTINKSQQDTVADLKLLEPTLKQLAASGSDLPKSLQLLVTPTFTDYAASTFKGDYSNLYANFDLNLGDVIDNLSRSRQNPLAPLLGSNPQTKGLVGGRTGTPPNQPPPLPIPQPGQQHGGPPRGGLPNLLGTLSNGGG